MTRFNEDHGVFLDEGMMGAQVRTLNPGTLGVHAVLISEGPGKHEDLFSTPVLVWCGMNRSPAGHRTKAVPASPVWNWSRYGDVVIMSAELELAAWSVEGTKLWTTPVEPPWSYEMKDDVIELDIMGVKSEFSLRGDPEDR
jgi:hypothetical protein